MNHFRNKYIVIILDFVKSNKTIAFIGFVSTIYCLVCVAFKISPTLNIPIKIQPFGDFLYNVSISVIAAVIFYIVQVYIPNKKKNDLLTKYAKKFIYNNLLNEYRILLTRLNCIYEGEKTEKEIKTAIYINSQKVKYALVECLDRYLLVMSDPLIETINQILFDDFFELVCIRSSGELVNKSLEEIVKDQYSYNRLCNYREIIKEELKKI